MTQQKPSVLKYYLKTWAIQNYYQYDIYQVIAGDVMWFMAEPKTKGVTRCANNEQELKVILENDATNITKFLKKVR